MRRRIIVLGLVILCTVGVSAQIVDNLPNGNRSTTNESDGKRAREITSAMLKKLDDPDVSSQDPATHNLPNQQIRDLYRKPTARETAIIAPSTKLTDIYADFLSQKRTGIVKLNADSQCSENTEIVSAADECSRYKIPGAGTSYSFRFESYRIPRLADLVLENDILRIDGIYQEGIMANLGDVPIESITLRSNGLKYLVELRPAPDSDELTRTETRLGNGIKADGYVYGLGFYAREKTTYVVRSIAFKGVFMRSLRGHTYDEFQFDKRADVVVVFRVVEKDPNGNVTIVWKELSRTDSRTLKINDPGRTGAK